MTQDLAAGPDPLVGQTVANKYNIVKLLGEGGMGCVYLAEQKLGTSTRKVALKTLHKHLSHDPSIKARFDREAGTVAALEHPNTIQVYDFGSMDDGTLYLVMEFVQGRSVADILEKDGPMQPPRVENIMRQVCGSLEEAHGHGIVHRDLKPDNVVLCERAGQKDWVEVLDFGIAKRSSEHDPNEAKLTQQGMVLGTPPYMSPEQYTGQPVDVRSDIYALGVMAYEMLTGRLPWEANTAWEWASKHMTEPPTPLERQPLGPNVPEKMKAAIVRALAKNKDERFGSVKEFFDAFQSGGAALPTAADAPPAMSGGAPPRMKTEMGAPVIPGPMGPPPGTPTPAFGGAPSGPSPGMPPSHAAAVPAAPMHTAGAQKKSNMPLILGLGGLALLLFIGAGIAVVATRPKPTTTSGLPDINASASADPTGSMAHTEEPPPVITSAAPLDTSGAKTAAVVTGGGGANTASTAKPVPTPKPTNTAAPTPTPQPPANDPEVCKKARQYKAAGKPAAIVGALEAQCRQAGGTP